MRSYVFTSEGWRVESSNETEFRAWMRRVGELCWRRLGVSVEDLPDMMFHDWFDEGISPERAFLRVLAELG